MSYITIVALLAFLTIHKSGSVGDSGGFLRCRCISLESRRIGRHIRVLEVSLPNSHCNHIEIIATLKKDGSKVCLNPDALWVKKVLKNLGKPRSTNLH